MLNGGNMNNNLSKKDVPKFDELFNPTLKVLKKLGGSASIHELETGVIEIMNIPSEIVSIPHSEQDSRSALEYRLAWTRTYLKRAGYLDNPKYGIWILTKKGMNVDKVDRKDVKITAKKNSEEFNRKKKLKYQTPLTSETDTTSDSDEVASWREEAIQSLLQISPDAFERLSQRILRESGFTKVEVTGRSGDGGIDGHGTMKIGLLSFEVFFQCKRYRGNVSSNTVRDFRGAMAGRAGRGIIITTGNFTRDAKAEAERDGTPPIDLIDGDGLLDLLKQYKLGVDSKQVENVKVNIEWFQSI